MAARIQLALALCLLARTAFATSFNVRNNCGSSLGIQVGTSAGAIGSSGFTLGPGSGTGLNPSDGWSGRIWLGLNSLIAEFTINSGGQDFYDVSAVDGFFLGIGMSLTGPGQSASCSANPGICPSGNVQGNACVNPNRDDGNTQYAQNVRASCPTVYSWSKDDTKTFAAPTGGTFTITFCP